MSAFFIRDPLVLVLIGLALLLASVLTMRFARRHRVWLLGLQPLAAGLLLAALLLRESPGPTALIVLTPSADIAALPVESRSIPVVALPGAPTTGDADRVPDLATALRRHPRVTSLQVLGDGLAAHDREAAAGVELAFTPSTATDDVARLVEVSPPRAVRAGAAWSVSGRVSSARAGVTLLDPSGKTVDAVDADDDGHFALHGLSRAAGPALFSLRLQEGDRVLQSLPLPVVARSPAAMRVLLLAAVPSPERKYLRRWALDAGIELDSRVALAPGLAQRRGVVALDAEAFERIDLLVADERSWRQLAPHLPALRAAIADGMGLMLRVTGPVPDAVARDWKTLGVDFAFAGARPIEVRLAASYDDADETTADGGLHAWPISLRGADHVPLLSAADDTTLAGWRMLGRGRIGVWWLTDSQRLVTRGRREAHATLWSDAWTTLARADAPDPIRLPERAVVGQRALICASGAGLFVEAPGGRRVALLRDPATGGCAAFWPTSSGWHFLIVERGDDPAPAATSAAGQGDAIAVDKHREAFHVFAPDSVATLTDAALREATLRLASLDELPTDEAHDRNPLRAALLAAWVLVMAALWWIERRVRTAARTI